MPYKIGCDIGGTFTDIVVYDDTGNKWVSKADTNPENLIAGVEEAINTVAADIGVSPSELLEETDRFVNGTTVVTNNILELDGAETGLLTTKGIGDTLRIARSPRGDERDQHEQVNVPSIVPKTQIEEIPERIDYAGEVVVPLDESAVREAIARLVDEQGVEAVAVCFLWSFLTPAHESRAKEIIHEEYPDIHVTTSHEVYPKIREYERMVTTVLNAYVAPQVSTYVDELRTKIGEKGLDTDNITIMQAAGGSTTLGEAKAKPIQLLDSGPVGGVIGAHELANTLDINNAIAADMGGTSFECSLVEDQEYILSERTEVLREVETGLTKIDTNTIGAGGGSVAWLDKRGVPQVGPESMGADPGPACYDQGGTKPTLTDIALVLGLMSPDAFLGGRRALSVDAAQRAVDEQIAEPLGRDIEDAAADLYEIGVNSMSNAVRNVTIEEGRDPTDFVFVAYGGALPMFAADICASLGIEKVLIPDTAPVFSANGLLQADDVRTFSESVFWEPGDPVEPINDALGRIQRRIQDQLLSAGFDDEDISVEYEGRFKFKGQLFDHPVTLPNDEITEDDLERIREEFPTIYEDEYGPGTAWVDAPVVLRGVRVTATGETEKPSLARQSLSEGTATSARSRDVYLPKERYQAPIDVYDSELLGAGTEISGPAIVDEEITTIFVPDEHELLLNRHGNYVLTRTGDRKRTPTSVQATSE